MFVGNEDTRNLRSIDGKGEGRAPSELAVEIQGLLGPDLTARGLRRACNILNALKLSPDSEALHDALRELTGGDIVARPRRI